MFERFTDRARRVLVLAQEESRLLFNTFIGTEHLLLGLIHEGSGIAARALTSLGVELDAARALVEEAIGKGGGRPSGSPPFTPRAKKVFEMALREAVDHGDTSIGTEHLLLGLLREGEGLGPQVLVALGTDLTLVRRTVLELMAQAAGEGAAAGVSAPGVSVAGVSVAGDAGTGSSDRPRPVVRIRSPRIAQRERCLMCDRDLWELEHFVVRGAGRRVCEDCIRSATALLDEAPSTQRQVTMGPRVYGRLHDDVAVDAVVAAVKAAFAAPTDPAARASSVEDFTELEHLFRRRWSRLAAQPDTAAVTRLRFLSPDLADARIELLSGDGSLVSFEGHLRRHDQRWMVGRDAVLALLA